jgi:hypothetical protein
MFLTHSLSESVLVLPQNYCTVLSLRKGSLIIVVTVAVRLQH